MNIFEPGFGQREAKLRYLDADFAVIQPGHFVTCAITGRKISLEDLTYWSVDKQEPYVDATASMKANAGGK
ncbi:DUF2093 domain-containing protein [Maritalea sp.]|uniref:DUF2093 domain-containing protein n=1 Tax=Maritalea sp. TaxID=2003361 RepID=UPI003EF0C522